MKDAFFFGNKESGRDRLFGTCTFPARDKPSDFGVLFCHALSEERQRSYRSVFLFAEMLADAGIPSLRFDYGGIGDSKGNFLDTTIDSMVDDTVCAYSEAKDRLNVDEVVTLGIRLGAAIATRAANRTGDVERVALWNPVVDGQRYYRELIRTEKIINLGRRSESNEPSSEIPGSVEVDAELFSPKLVEQLCAIDLASEPHTARKYFIAGREQNEAEQKQIERLAEHLRKIPIQTSSWSKEAGDLWTTASMYDAFYPLSTFAATLTWLGIPTESD